MTDKIEPGKTVPIKPDPSLEPATTPSDQHGPAPFRAQVWHDIAIFFRLLYHFWVGFHFMRKTRRAITIFGSARLAQDHEFCKSAYSVAKSLGAKGFTIITGGGPSIMEAANHGAKDAGANSIGINIQIPHEQHINAFVTRGIKSRYFFVRKVLLCRYSEAFVIYPGGFGTLDEMFELVTLIQTGKMVDRPVILVNRQFWTGLIEWLRRTVHPAGMLSARELDRLRVVDTEAEVLEYLDQRLHKIYDTIPLVK
ncbi:MAG: TIGR00730 family Rossman fold protein [Bdellovibrionales bacterium]|nr:TIGR00730 family Rossman fold protein [Bdellovibrionales bacterium]